MNFQKNVVIRGLHFVAYFGILQIMVFYGINICKFHFEGVYCIMLQREIVFLPLEKVQTNPNQPRRIFDPSHLEELAASIRTYGVLQPISVRFVAGYQYELIAGERRLRASHLAGLETIPAVIVNVSEQDSAVLALVENLQRQNLHYLEEAEGFLHLINDFGMTQEEVAERIGKTQSCVANKLRVNRLSSKVQEILIANELTERHARALLRLNDENLQIDVLDKVIKQGLTVRRTEELIESLLIAPAEDKKAEGIRLYIRDLRLLTNSIKDNLKIMERSGMESTMEVQKTENGYTIHIALHHSVPEQLTPASIPTARQTTSARLHGQS